MRLFSKYYSFLVLISLLLNSCIDREKEDLSTSFQYVLDGTEVNKVYSGNLYSDDLLTIGGNFITLDGLEEKRYEIGPHTGNLVQDEDWYRSDQKEGKQGFVEIQSIDADGEYWVINGIFEFDLYNPFDLQKKRSYKNGIFKNLLVANKSENLSIGKMEMSLDGVYKKYNLGIKSAAGNSETFYFEIYKQELIKFRIPQNLSPGEYILDRTDDFAWIRFEYHDQVSGYGFNNPHFDAQIGWPVLKLEEVNYFQKNISGTLVGKFTSNDSTLVEVDNCSFEFYW